MPGQIKDLLSRIADYVELDDFVRRMRQMPLRGHLFYLSIFLIVGYFAVAARIVSYQPGELVDKNEKEPISKTVKEETDREVQPDPPSQTATIQDFSTSVENPGASVSSDVLVAPYPLGVSPYEKGKAEEGKGNFDAACKLFRDGAAQKDAKSINGLGACYFNGWGGVPDYRKAIDHFHAAAEMGWYKATANLAYAYKQGLGVPRDIDRASRLLKQVKKPIREAATRGDKWAQNLFGAMHNEGLGVPADPAEAVKWFREAANLGLASAQYNLGWAHGNGDGVPLSYVRAHMWFSIAASNGHRGGELGKDTFEGLMDAAQLAEAQELARKWIEGHQN